MWKTKKKKLSTKEGHHWQTTYRSEYDTTHMRYAGNQRTGRQQSFYNLPMNKQF